MNDLFRFATIRAPQAVVPPRAGYVDTADPDSSVQAELKAAADSGASRQDIHELAEAHLASDQYVLSLDTLTIPLQTFGQAIDDRHPTNRGELDDLVKDVFGKNAADLIASMDYRATRRNLTDSLIALTIVSEDRDQVFDDLADALRWCRLLERIAERDASLNEASAVEEALNQTILLPDDIFPLPPFREKTEIPSEQQIVSPGEQEAHEIERKLMDLQEAYDALAAATASDLKPIETKPIIETLPARDKGLSGRVMSFLRPEVVDIPPLSESPWLLSDEFVSGLSDNTKKVLVDLGISLDVASLPEVTRKVEAALVRVGSLLPAEEPDTLVRVGSDFVSTATILGDTPLVFTEPGELTTFTLVKKPRAFRAIGIADLMVVRQHIQKYEPGEIAHIENVLKGESRKREHRRARIVEEVLELETETYEATEKDLQSTERFEMRDETARTIRQDSKLEAGVSVSASYGPFVKVSANLGYSSRNAREESRRSATSFARDVTERSVSRIEERVREERMRKTVEEFEEKNLHSIENADGDGHITGIYRWVDKKYKVEVVNYGQRLMFEFIVPEPAVFLLHTLVEKPRELESLRKPAPPRDSVGLHLLQPRDINPYNYQKWVVQYGVVNVKPPPPLYTTAAYTNKAQMKTKDMVWEDAAGEIEIPRGYSALSAFARVVSSPDVIAVRTTSAVISIGRSSRIIGPAHGAWSLYQMPLANEIDKLPIGVIVRHKGSYAATVEVLCKRTEHKYQEWQQETYDQIMAAYLNQKLEYEEALASAVIEEGIAITGRSPEQNRQVEKTELKKSCIALLMNDNFTDTGAIEIDSVTKYPQINLDRAHAKGEHIQFLEQAFEWTQMAYVFYPYYWARKVRWDFLQRIEDNDPFHAEFLKAGAARVVVPVRPEYEQAVLYYQKTHEPWQGGTLQTVTSLPYLPIVEDLKERLDGKRDGKVVESWEVKMPTSLVLLQPDAKLPDWTEKKATTTKGVNHDEKKAPAG